MDKNNCDIIRDLIPSYVDEICSQTTREWVEEHIQTCGECRLMAARCRDQALSAQKLERQSLDGLKKITDILKYQNMISYVLLLFVVFLGVLLFFVNRYSSLLRNQPGPLILCLTAAILFSMGRRGTAASGKQEYLLGGICLAIHVYFPSLFSFFLQELSVDAVTVFGIELHQIGPFMERQLIAAYFVQTALLVYSFYRIMHHDRNCHWLLCLNLTGIFLLFNYYVWLKHMDSFETLKSALFESTLLLMGIGLLATAASLAIPRLRRSRLQSRQ